MTDSRQRTLVSRLLLASRRRLVDAKKIGSRVLDRGVATLLGGGCNVYWYDEQQNFGDLLTPALLRKYGLRPVHSSSERSQLVMIGSLLQVVSSNYEGVIFGTGLISRVSRTFPRATIAAVRGVLTRDLICAPGSTILGDPGLLADELLPIVDVQKRVVVGVVPHYVDRGDQRLQALRSRYPSEIRIIDVRQSPEVVVAEIAGCEAILSSSLHGLIVADALRIPNAWMPLSSNVTGGGFKFMDYGSALGVTHRPIEITGTEKLSTLIRQARKASDRVEDIRARLRDGLQQIVIPYLNGES